MKKKIIAILSLVLILSFTIISAKEYSDINDHWALEYIMDMTNQGILQGYPDGTFKAEEDVSYGEFITALNRLVIENYEEKAGDGWSKHAIDKAQEAGYVRDTDFNPDDPIDRDTVFHYIYMCFRPEANESVLDKFKDTDDLKYRVDASALVNAGIVLGYPDGTIKPKETITRAETAKLLKELGDFRLGLLDF